MDSIVCNVRDVEAEERHTLEHLEHVVGHALCDNHQLMIQVCEVDGASEVLRGDGQPVQTLSDWISVYDGLSRDEIDAIDRTIKTRANLMRNSP
jgi:hypothetical protein